MVDGEKKAVENRDTEGKLEKQWETSFMVGRGSGTGMKGFGKVKWPQMRQIWDFFFFRSVSIHFGFKNPRSVSFEDNLTQFGANPDISCQGR